MTAGSTRRRRPGQRANASKAAGRSGYDIEQDKHLRALAKFKGESLGRTIKGISVDRATCNELSRSYLANEEIEHEENNELSTTEWEILELIINHDNKLDSPLRSSHPWLYGMIRSYAVADLSSKLAKAKRARHIGNVMRVAEQLRNSARYKNLEIDEGLAACIPY